MTQFFSYGGSIVDVKKKKDPVFDPWLVIAAAHHPHKSTWPVFIGHFEVNNGNESHQPQVDHKDQEPLRQEHLLEKIINKLVECLPFTENIIKGKQDKSYNDE